MQTSPTTMLKFGRLSQSLQLKRNLNQINPDETLAFLMDNTNKTLPFEACVSHFWEYGDALRFGALQAWGNMDAEDNSNTL